MSLTKRLGIFAYGVFSYLVFFATFLYAVGFIGNFGVPVTIDGPAVLPLWQALLVNLGLLTLFALQHSVMARPFFKRWLTRYIPFTAERSTYVLFSSIALILLFIFWQPLGGTVWEVQGQAARASLYALYALGWLVILATSFLINHFDLFGLRQVWFALRDKAYAPLKFVTPAPYRMVRHPLYVGWLMVFWAAPTMTVTHLLFAVVTTLYILVGIQLEERDLMDEHPEYRQYRKQVPMLIPRLSGKGRPAKGTVVLN
jgi:methanethiol S-methyltransferase